MAYTYVIGVCLKKTLNEKQRRKRKKIVGMPEKQKKIIGRVEVVIVMILTWYLAAMI
jgi:hypothetical protein